MRVCGLPRVAIDEQATPLSFHMPGALHPRLVLPWTRWSRISMKRALEALEALEAVSDSGHHTARGEDLRSPSNRFRCSLLITP